MNATLWKDPGDHNWLGVWTLYMREVRRFTKIYTQTMLAPVVTTLLFLAVFSLVIGPRAENVVGGVPFLVFLVPGLIMMAIAQNAFGNTSSSIVVAKIQGNIVDTLMPPFSADELTLAIALGGATRGIAVGLSVAVAMSFFVPVQLHNVGFIVFHGFMASLMLSLLGLMGGIWSVKFDHIAAVTNFVVTPLSFLSGTFYSIQQLPELAQTIAHFNPFFYMIDGFRYGFIGASDTEPMYGLVVMTGTTITLWLICRHMFKIGYRLRS
jgi:ABC-2 type transport system permease protein